MENLQEKFKELSRRIRQSGKPAAEWFPLYNSTTLLSADNWWEAFAVCEYALDTGADRELTARFFELIFSSYDCNVEVDLNDEEYEFWWEKVMTLCDRVAEFDGAGWAEKAAQYANARYGKRDESYLFPYYQKAAEMGHAIAQSVIPYWLYLGLYCERDVKESERRFAALSSPEAVWWGKLNRSYIAEFEGNKEEALRMRRELLADIPASGERELRMRAQVYIAMGDALDREEGFVREEADCYEKARELQPSSRWGKNLGTLYFRYPELGKPKELAFEMWEKAFRFGEWSAANFLGYYYQEPEWLDIPKAIAWLEKGMLYGEAYSAFELALIYLYNEEYRNVARGIACLERCVDAKYEEGFLALSDVYLNGEWVEKDVDKAIQLLKRSAECGSGRAAYRLACLYESGVESGEPDYAKALKWFRRAGNLGYAEGYSRFAFYAAEGQHVKRNLKRAKTYYELAAKKGSCYARVELAFLYENGDGVEQNFEKAFQLLDEAAGMGYPYAMYRIGLYKERGITGEPAPEEAFEWYRKAADEGVGEAVYALARCCRTGVGTEESLDRAIAYLEQGAEQEEPRCLTDLGLMYENGNGVEEDSTRAVDYMRRAAERNYGYAQFKMGDYYLFGYQPCMEDNKKAVEWYEKAVANGVPMAMLRMGDYYLYDYDRRKEPEKAFAYYKRAADSEWYNEGLGLCYELGIGVEDNVTEAFKYYMLAAKADCVVAMYRVGLCYYNEVGVKKNLTEAYRWFNDAANQDNVAATYYVGKMTLYGEGCASNPEAGVGYLRKAAERDNDKAQFELGNAYLMGMGVEADEEQAMKWFERAAENGNEQALKITGRRTK